MAARGTTGGAYSGATLRALGAKYRSNALAQEKTGEFLVNGKVLGAPVRGDFEHCEVALFVGKNPWQSHGFPHARTTLKEVDAAGADASGVVPGRSDQEVGEAVLVHVAGRAHREAGEVAARLPVEADAGADAAGGQFRPPQEQDGRTRVDAVVVR